MDKNKVVSLKRLQAERKRAQQERIKITFTIDPESERGRLFLLAVNHYTGGRFTVTDWSSAIAKSILTDWLAQHVQFPALELSGEV